LRKRVKRNLDHRIFCGWMKFGALTRTLTNRKISIRLRLRLFDACVSTSVLYSLSSTPLTGDQLQRLDATQRIMVRKIIGWARWDEESWQQTGHRMKQRLHTAMVQSKMRSWSEVRNNGRDRLIAKSTSGYGPQLLTLDFVWRPPGARRGRGRPRHRWTD